MPKIDHKKLLDFCKELLSAGGIPSVDAHLVASLLVRAELRGYAGHGVTRVGQYLQFIENKIYDLNAAPAVEREGKITAVVDGKHYIGQVAAHMAMQMAIHKAKEHGAGIVCVRRAGHTGRLADYMEMATEQGLLGMGAVLGAGQSCQSLARIAGPAFAGVLFAEFGRHVPYLVGAAIAAVAIGLALCFAPVRASRRS